MAFSIFYIVDIFFGDNNIISTGPYFIG